MSDTDTARERLGQWVRERRVKFAAECRPCELCAEPYCDECDDHYADCGCPGPHSEEGVQD